MLPEEARWFRRQLESLPPADLFPLLNVGSSTRHFREVEQPWIEQEIFAPLRRAGHTVIHSDLKAVDGVDLVGDLTDPAFLATLHKMGVRSVLCSNLLEHLTERVPLTRAISALLPAGGYILASCPYSFPYHPDPIDNGFRPTVQELAAEFPAAQLLAGEIVAGYTFWQQINRGPAYLGKLFLRMLLPFYKPRMWWSIVQHTRWLRRPFTASCALLRKPFSD